MWDIFGFKKRAAQRKAEQIEQMARRRETLNSISRMPRLAGIRPASHSTAMIDEASIVQHHQHDAGAMMTPLAIGLIANSVFNSSSPVSSSEYSFSASADCSPTVDSGYTPSSGNSCSGQSSCGSSSSSSCGGSSSSAD